MTKSRPTIVEPDRLDRFTDTAESVAARIVVRAKKKANSAENEIK